MTLQFDKPFIQPLIKRLQEQLWQPVTVTVTGSITVTETEEEAENMHGAEAAPCQPTVPSIITWHCAFTVPLRCSFSALYFAIILHQTSD